MADFFVDNFIAVYFFYGLSFFTMALAVWLERGHASDLEFSRSLGPLAGFGLIHGSHEWFEMFLLIYQRVEGETTAAWIPVVRLAMLAGSFIFLVLFGARLLSGPAKPRRQWQLLLIVFAVWVIGVLVVWFTQPAGRPRIIGLDVYTRYALAIPGAALTAWGLFLQRRKLRDAGLGAYGRDVVFAGLAFAGYGGIGQLFASPSTVFPSAILNSDAFLRWFGFPVQVFRASMATLAAIFIIRSLRAIETETQRRIAALREAQLTERRRLEETRAELLHRSVQAQELERQRVARELHDATGQTLTALGLGLRSLTESIPEHPERAIQQAATLERVATDGLAELEELVSGLHPPQLDELGLPAALRWYAGQVTERVRLPIEVTIQGAHREMPSEVKTVLFRIAQEAMNNIANHARASQANVRLFFTADGVTLQVDDNGRGFDVESIFTRRRERPCWGLLGMQERASLAGGTCSIRSEPGLGTRVEAEIPLVDAVAT